MNLFKAIGLKLASALLFTIMQAMVRIMGQVAPVGQIVFFRALFAIVPVVVIYAFRRELMQAVRTNRPFGHIGRGTLSVVGMFSNFASLARLPLADATAISFASPLITVALAAWILKERVRIYRWSAVVVGFTGVIVMLVPHFDFSHYSSGAGLAVATAGAIFALLAALFNAGTVIQTRRLTSSETTPSIVFYFSLSCAIAGAVTLPFAWHTPSWGELAMLVSMGILGGIAHLILTESYRFASASVLAPFDYSAMLWALIFGFWLFGELPTALVYVGAAIVAGAGLFVIWRERQLGLKRRLEEAGPRAPT
ncbi:MAG: DMT family transporter [Pseudolabrys sp.]|nr:DMT family transporter [Pseudolabrys sp.]MBV9956680.1 DMT family transporter [Pseudolabrys sp.]